ncbi:hypothetical protein DRP07_07530 [Archaeoglobales archaeon]|nr:MAG: hypothetical protein DRP07_07530 [Archaeoglobales archaeon]
MEVLERERLGEELLEVFRRLPKESFELFLRNLNIRRYVENLWENYKRGRLEYDENFDKIFREIFEIFFRPIELLISGYRFVFGFIRTPNVFEIEGRRELMKAYNEFINSYFKHLELLFNSYLNLFLPEISRNAVDTFILSWQNTFQRYFDTFTEWNTLTESPFVIPKKGSEALLKCLEYFNKFKVEFSRFKQLVEESYMISALNFIEHANSNEIESFNEFITIFSKIVSEEFDEVLASEEYLKIQSGMLENMMMYVKYARKHLEIILESNPLNPLATQSELDEAYKRIHDLKRKVRELEKRIEELERLSRGG